LERQRFPGLARFLPSGKEIATSLLPVHVAPVRARKVAVVG